MVVIAQRDVPTRLAGSELAERLLVALKITAAAHLHRNRQFVSIQRLGVLAWLRAVIRIPGVLLRVLRIYVDQLDDEIAVASGS